MRLPDTRTGHADRYLTCNRHLSSTCRLPLTEVAMADFLHIETGHLSHIGASSLTDEERDVADPDLGSDEISTSYIPFRNANLLSIPASYAEATDSSAVFIGVHSEDFSGYPDCRPVFFDAFQNVIDVGTKPETEIELKPPFVEWPKRL